MALRSTRSYNESDQKELWKEFKEGDRGAFETIYRSHFHEMYRYGMTILPNEALIKDSIQQVFVDLWSSRGRLTDVEHISFYLIKSLRSRIFRYIKESKKMLGTDSHACEWSLEYLPSYEARFANPQDHSTTRVEKLRVTVNELPTRQREVIMLIFFESRSYEEVSMLLSMNIQSVYTLVWRSLSSLRKKLRNI